MIKKILITLLVLIVLLVVGLTIFLLTFDLNHYREFTQKQLSKALNYPVQIGSMRTKLSLVPTIQINNFKIYQNGDNPQVIIDVPQMEAEVEILPLLKKKIEVKEIKVLLVSADLTLLSKNEPKTTEKQGKKEVQKSDSNAILDQLWVQKITVDRILCRFMNKGKKEAVELNKLSLNELNKFKFQVVYDKKKIDVKGSLGLVTKLIKNPKTFPVDLKLEQNNASVTLRGKIDNLKNIRLDANINILKLATFLRSWNITVPKFLDVSTVAKFSLGGNLQKMTLKDINLNLDKKALVVTANGQATQLEKNPWVFLTTKSVLKSSNFSEKMGLKPFEMTLDISAGTQKVTLKKINFRAGRSDISGDIEINWKDLLSVNPVLSSNYLNLKDLLYDQQPAATKPNNNAPKTPNAKKTSLIPNTKIDWTVLNKFNMKGKIDVAHLFLTDHITDHLNISISPRLEKGRLFSPFKGRIIGGDMSGDINLNVNQKNIALNFVGKNLDLDKIRSVNTTIKKAKINTDIALKSRGDTLKELVARANGKIVVELLGGTITDKWFNSLPITLNRAKQKSGLLDFSTSDQKTEITCGAINIPIKDGVITSDEKIALQTDALNFVAKGQVNLRNETLNMTIIPSVNQTRGMANQLLTTVQAVHLKGPWQNIEPTVDAGQAIGNIAQAASQKLTGQKPQIVNSTDLCQKVLGKAIKQTTTQTTVPKQVQTQTQTQQKQPVSKKENLKQQLIQSLSEALQSQVQK